jgi:alanyl-tRNA synthetase
MRRAIRHARLLGNHQPLLHNLVHEVCKLFGEAYPELKEGEEGIVRAASAEEKRFGQTFDTAIRQFDNAAQIAKANYIGELLDGLPAADPEIRHMYQGYLLPGNSDADKRNAAEKIEPRDVATVLERARKLVPRLIGSEAFRLYDTFGLARDFIADLSRDAGLEVDWVGFEKAMQEQRKRARASWKGGTKGSANLAYAKIAETFKTEPDFYFATSTKDCRIEAIVSKNGSVAELKAGETGEVVLDRTVIYAESGGQVADTGAFYDTSESQILAEVKGAFYPVAGLIAHKVVAKEALRVGDRVSVVADAARRELVMRNHTGTHLVHAALRNILGTHVKQAGSLNAPERLRFDFSHFAHVDAEELKDIEQQVNEEIRLNTELETSVTSLEDALASGALAFFGDKYPEHNVRVVTIPDSRAVRGFYSKELCGGTHVKRAGDIGVLKIVSEESVAAGVRRIEAVTGIGALEHYQKQAQLLAQLASQLNVGQDEVFANVEKLAQTARQLEKQLGEQKRKGALGQLDELAAKVQLVKGVKVIAAEVENVDREGLRQLVDSLRQRLGSGVVALGMPEDGKIALIAGVTKDLTAKVHAGKLIQALAKQLGGSGGGRPDLAEAGGKDTAGLKMALQSLPTLLEPLL